MRARVTLLAHAWTLPESPDASEMRPDSLVAAEEAAEAGDESGNDDRDRKEACCVLGHAYLVGTNLHRFSFETCTKPCKARQHPPNLVPFRTCER